ncbi:MAG: hypothetical protein R3B96_09075 [Pirellulaceae bacterium]
MVREPESTVNDLLNFTHDREPQRQTQDASRLLAEVLEEIGPHLRAHDIEVETEVESGTVGCFDPTMVRRALINLVLNAVDAMAEGGKLRITVDRHEGCDEQASQGQAERARSTSVLRWQVADSGRGSPPRFSRRESIRSATQSQRHRTRTRSSNASPNRMGDT